MTLQEEENRVIKGLRRYPIGTDLKIPINDNSVQSIMKYNSDIYNSSYMNNTEWNSNMEVRNGSTLEQGWIQNFAETGGRVSGWGEA